MFNLQRSTTSARSGPGRGIAPRQGYRVTGILGLALALMVGWGQLGGGGAVSPIVAHADAVTPAYPLYAWGYNSYGQLGNGSAVISSPTPVAASLPAGVGPGSIAAGYSHSMAIGSDNKLYTWGYNSYGQLGNGTNTASFSPVAVSLPAGVTPIAIAGGGSHSLAIGSDGNLYTWGGNFYGQLGNGTTTDSSTPVTVSLPAGVTPTVVAAGNAHSLAIGSDGNLYAWGDNGLGQLGNGSPALSSTVPVQVSLPAGVMPTAIAAGYGHSLAIGSNGKLYAWGFNQFGQLGTSTTANSSIPLTVSLPTGATPTAIAAGYLHSLAAGSNGKLYAWGFNNNGQLGNGTTSGNHSNPNPVTVTLPAGVAPGAVAAGQYHSLTSGSDGKLYAWGSNQYGQLGNGTNTNSSTPLVVGSVAGIAHPQLAAGYYHSMAVLVIPGQIIANGGNSQSATVSTVFSIPLVASVRDVANNPVSSLTVTFTAPTSGASGTFAGGNSVYTATSDASGLVTTTSFTANAIAGSYNVTATVSGVITPATFSLTNLSCNPLNVTSGQDDGSCGTLRQALTFASANPTKTVMINLTAGTTISLTTGLTLTSGIAITTTAPCGVGAGNTMLPPVTIQGVGSNSGNGLTLSGNNQLYGLWVRGFSGVQIKAPPGSSTKMQCVRASKL